MKHQNRPVVSSIKPRVEGVGRSNSGQSPRPDSYDPMKLQVSQDFTFGLRKRGISKLWSVVRFLYSKAVYEPSKLDLLDLFILDSALEQLLLSKTESWNKQNRKRLINVSNCFKLVRSSASGQVAATNGLRIFLNNIERGFIHSAHAYFGRRNDYSPKDWIKTTNRRLKKSPPPKRYIGVGYQDHGARRIHSYDASPSWQEVASTRGNLSVSVNHREPPGHLLVTFSLFQRKLVPYSRPE